MVTVAKGTTNIKDHSCLIAVPSPGEKGNGKRRGPRDFAQAHKEYPKHTDNFVLMSLLDTRCFLNSMFGEAYMCETTQTNPLKAQLNVSLLVNILKNQFL